MAKKKRKAKNQHAASKKPNAGHQEKGKKIEDFARAAFQKRSNQFQGSGTGIREVFEGLDFDHVHVKRRIRSSLSMIGEVTKRFGAICPDVPGQFSLAEDWITVNAYPISAYDYVESHIHSALGAAIWILDCIRDNGKLSELAEVLSSASSPESSYIPPVWDACHSEQLLAKMVSVIHNRNTDCALPEKCSQKEKRTFSRCYMDKCTAEGKIDHSVPSRILFDRVIRLIDQDAIDDLKEYYTDKYWDWLRRFYLCRELLIKEELQIRADIEDFQNSTQQTLMQNKAANAISPSTFGQQSILMPRTVNTSGISGTAAGQEYPDYSFQFKGLEYKNSVLYRRQTAFNSRFEAFSREVGEFPLLPYETLSTRYGSAIADIWTGFEVKDPYTMCAGFLFLLDSGSDLPWCYFAGINLQSFYVSMLPWTRSKFTGSCDDIWEHFDADTGRILPGPGTEPLPRKIKIPEMDDWYQMKYFDVANKDSDDPELYNLSHILYEITGCIMPRNLERYRAALKTLNRYGINNKKTNLSLTYCMALLGEAKHQSNIFGLSDGNSSETEEVTPYSDESLCKDDSIESLKEMISSLRAEIRYYKQTVQSVNQELMTEKNRIRKMEKQAAVNKQELEDMGSLIFGIQDTGFSLGISFPYRTASHIIVFGGELSWRNEIKAKLPDILFFDRITKSNCDALRKADMVWIQITGTSYSEYLNIVLEIRKYGIPVRYFSCPSSSACATQLVKADIASC
ncbi:MAG: hypothetical protein ACI4TK_01645 [Agathobacter sp.]